MHIVGPPVFDHCAARLLITRQELALGLLHMCPHTAMCHAELYCSCSKILQELGDLVSSYSITVMDTKNNTFKVVLKSSNARMNQRRVGGGPNCFAPLFSEGMVHVTREGGVGVPTPGD